MLGTPRSVERLPDATQAKLRSTTILTSLPQIVSELLQNSLDANATRIEIGVDCKEWTMWIKDDGQGINKEGLERIGRGADGGRYNTSKQYAAQSLNSLSTFGFRGEALASAADVSCLEICSRTAYSRDTWSVILKGGNLLYHGEAVRWKRESHGTVVCLRDIFYNLPIRRNTHPPPTRTLELIREEVETFVLVFPGVAISLEDTSNDNPSQPRRDKTLRYPKTRSIVDSFRHCYGSAFTEHIEPIQLESESIKMDGFISLHGSSSKSYQFLYINRHPISQCDLHRVIDQQFSTSSFGKNALDELGEKDLPRSLIRRSPRKVEKKPAYVLNISIPADDVDNCVDPTKHIVQIKRKDIISRLLSSVAQDFIRKHGFVAAAIVNPSQQLKSPSRKRRRQDIESNSELYDCEGFVANTLNEHPVSSLQGFSTSSLTRSLPIVTPYASLDDDSSKEVAWIDPSTGERFVLDSRTGNSIRHADCIQEGNEEGRRTFRQYKASSSALAFNDLTRKGLPDWLSQALNSNNAYSLTENRIPSIDSNLSLIDNDSTHRHAYHGSFNRQTVSSHIQYRHDPASIRFSKDGLHSAIVINQVDRKFIACLIPAPGNVEHSLADIEGQNLPCDSGTLVLIDQHAADERVRVERFLKELCSEFLLGCQMNGLDGVRSRELTPPRPVLLTQHEALTIKRSPDVRDFLGKWGVRFSKETAVMRDSENASETGSNSGYLQLLLSGIPEMVSEKLLQGDELRDFIKGILGQIQNGELTIDSTVDLPFGLPEESEFSWYRAVRRCPRVLLDLINSKACRGAVMFNDALSIEQCERLVKELSETAFPFQCAHGRPSLIPLLEIGGVEDEMANK
ncbi:hypothetical protein BJ165DRAFT_1379790 [Panaeolus papilionaceus]|nr:hypothetical protein BJ165DRAFT_1379790 [Panaeolus papilionaceus]